MHLVFLARLDWYFHTLSNINQVVTAFSFYWSVRDERLFDVSCYLFFAFFQRSVLCLSMSHLSINFKYFEPSTSTRFLCFEIVLHVDLHVVHGQRHGCLRWQMNTLISYDPKWIEAPRPLSWILPASTLLVQCWKWFLDYASCKRNAQELGKLFLWVMLFLKEYEFWGMDLCFRTKIYLWNANSDRLGKWVFGWIIKVLILASEMVYGRAKIR